MRGLLFALLLAGCSSGSGARPAPARKAPEPIALKVAYSTEPAAPGSETIRGRVRLVGKLPRGGCPRAPLPDVQEPPCDVHRSPILHQPDLVRGPEGELADVLVAVRWAGPAGDPPKDPAVLEQTCIRLVPRVVAVRVGQPLRVRNAEDRLHNFHTTPVRNAELNFAHRRTGEERTLQFEVPELGIKAKCDVHGWEHAWIHVLEHPYFAITGPDGRFAIQGLPPGEHRLFVWHEKLGEMIVDRMIRMVPKESAELDLTIQLPRP